MWSISLAVATTNISITSIYYCDDIRELTRWTSMITHARVIVVCDRRSTDHTTHLSDDATSVSSIKLFVLRLIVVASGIHRLIRIYNGFCPD
jgi:hypothetical protein